MSEAILDRITQQLTTLQGLTTKASEASESLQVPRTLQSACSAFHKAITGLMVDYTEGEGEEAKTYKVLPDSLVTIIGADASNNLQSALEVSKSVSEALNAITGSDRSEGDKLARGLSMACEQGWLEGDARTEAEKAVEAWNKTAPTGKRTRTSNGESKPVADALPFDIRVTCEHDKWTATQGTNLNSLRWAWILHHEAAHGVKPSKGNPLWQGVTDGIKAVMDGAEAAQGGPCIIVKA